MQYLNLPVDTKFKAVFEKVVQWDGLTACGACPEFWPRIPSQDPTWWTIADSHRSSPDLHMWSHTQTSDTKRCKNWGRAISLNQKPNGEIFVVFEIKSHCSPGSPWTGNPSASVSGVLRHWAWTMMPDEILRHRKDLGAHEISSLPFLLWALFPSALSYTAVPALLSRALHLTRSLPFSHRTCGFWAWIWLYRFGLCDKSWTSHSGPWKMLIWYVRD